MAARTLEGKVAVIAGGGKTSALVARQFAETGAAASRCTTNSDASRAESGRPRPELKALGADATLPGDLSVVANNAELFDRAGRTSGRSTSRSTPSAW